MKISDYFLKWLKSPYEVREQMLEYHANKLIAGGYHSLGLKHFLDITAMINRMSLHQEETTKRRMK